MKVIIEHNNKKIQKNDYVATIYEKLLIIDHWIIIIIAQIIFKIILDILIQLGVEILFVSTFVTQN